MTRFRPTFHRAATALAAASLLTLCLAPGCRRSQPAPVTQEYAPAAREAAPVRRDIAPVPTRRQDLSRINRQTRSDTVHVTESGKKYHRRGCTYLKKSRQTLSRDKAQRDGFTACSVCQP